MLRRLLLGAAGVTALLALSACSSPHHLQPDPKRSVAVPASGSGQAVTVIAADDRPSDVLGTRSGSASSTATISVSPHEIVPRLQAEVERAVREMGFSPTAEPAPGRPSLTLTLKKLSYERGQSQPLVDEARLESVIEAEASNDGQTYTGTYTSRRVQSYAVKPDKATNQRMVTDLLTDGLNRAFADPELGQLLAR
ncbi:MULTISPECIES: YajG family lipoprotein [Halomonas]|uniref:YajG family lipoprotein n=3 Tax=Halomonas TaxID=2745 RepID=A0AAU7KKL9_9GAMM|nr:MULTISPECIES: YajG family lipoprotein [Halomonas]MBR9771672.1 hypothetical protein [Gammaproteobacteria bacterium]HAR06872.1 hypothetical protein [Cobetia sp.]KJZ17080.1 hypothetical protein TW86_04980 [Halomonas sp. S2151]MAR72224.1 hypothetical protein [Halomonas sp.]MBR9881887.1 hypothetical protein [Gammaproteobacteria bacterium]|tara:strand:+ start:1874 stop:2461 length:588 start_codon:yes stop_codon:yes gene_type:complete